MKHHKRLSVGSLLFKVILYVYAVVNLYPLIWMLFYSFKDNLEIFATNPFGPPTVLASTTKTTFKAWHTFPNSARHISCGTA
ncbi:MAG: hypothetical protein ACLTSG_09375 [Lachnospiraceae bacterium]